MNFWKAFIILSLGLLSVQIDAASVEARDLEIFVAFGPQSGDWTMYKNDDGWLGPIDISTKFPFFNQSFSTVIVNTNGLVTFDQSISEFRPQPFPLAGLSGLSAFWNDIDTTKGGDIFYREIGDQETLNAVAGDIRRAFWQYFNFRPSFAFVVTWLNVAAYQGNRGLRNTFQAVITTNGKHSFAIFNYDKLEWSMSENIYDHALVGFNAGDGVISYTVEGSTTSAILTLTNRSNVGVPGKFIFKIDDEDIVDGGCNDGGMVSIKPAVVSFTGDQELEITGPCFNDTDRVELVFPNETTLAGGDRVRCSVVDRVTAVCRTGFFNRLGNHEVKLLVNDDQTFQGRLIVRDLQESDAIYGLEPSYEVSADGNSTLELTKISWDRGTNAAAFDGYVVMYSLIDDENRQTIYKPLSLDIPSSATEALIDLNIIREDILASRGKISQFYKAIVKVFKKIKDKVVPYKTVLSDIWNAGVTYFKDCDAWHKDQPNPWPIMNALPPCPRLVPTSFPKNLENFEWDGSCNPNKPDNCNEYHPGSHGCYRDVGVSTTITPRPGQQCCYSRDGALIVGPPGGGTLDLVSPSYNVVGHFGKDVVPWKQCCIKENKCDKYYEKRPSDDGARWQPPAPAGGSGDPHFLTLDGLGYTFNGQGEYTLLRVDQAELEAQVRLMPYKTRSGMPASEGTVFKAIAVKATEHDSVQIELSETNQIIFYLNGVIFDGLEDGSLPLKGVVVAKSQDHYWIQYSVGVSIEVSMTPEKDALAIVVTASRALNGKTKGLLGVMDQDVKNDFTLPSGQVLNLDAANDRLVYEKFAVHWQTTESSSVFTYMDGFGHSSFVDAAYKPKFMSDGIAFENKTLEQMAKSLCKDNQQCLFDVATTKQLGLGSLSLEFDEAIKETEKNNEIAKQTCVRLFEVFENGRRTIKSLDSGFEYTASCNKDFCFEHDQKQQGVTFRCEKGEYDRQIPRCVPCNSASSARINGPLMVAMLAFLSFLIRQ